MNSSTNKNSTKDKGPRTKINAAGRKLILFAACSFLFCVSFLSIATAKPSVYIRKLKNDHYQLMVGRRPYIVKGVCYNPVPTGENHEYDWWSDPNKPWITDGKLMRDMGVNTVRIYQTGKDPEAVKKVIKDLYELYGIRTVLGHWLGFWEYPCPLYGDKDFQERIKNEVLDMVSTYKNEPGVLFWILGNENNYSCQGSVNVWSSDQIDMEADPQKQRAMRYEVFYSFVNSLAEQIHKIDHEHPVALGNGELVGLEFASKFCPDIDFIACIIYRGKTFGSLFRSLKTTFDKPICISEFGADAYDAYLKKEDQNMQAFFLEALWRQIYDNLANRKEGAGNCIGGMIFEWTDEWWKHNEGDAQSRLVHDTESNWSNGAYYFDIKANKNMNEEWFGIVALSEEQESGLNKRIPRKAYYVIREFWKHPLKSQHPRVSAAKNDESTNHSGGKTQNFSP